MYTQIRGLQIVDGGVDTLQLASNAVTTVKITDKNVTLAKIEDGADKQLVIVGAGGVPAYQTVSGDVTIGNTGVVAIGSSKVLTAMINADAVDATKVADDAIGAEHINAGAESDGYVLTTDAVGGLTWTAKSSVSEDYVQEAEIKLEDYSGDIDGFELVSAPVANSVQIYLNGALQAEGSGKDYTLTGSTVAWVVAPTVDDIILVHYIAT